MAGRAMTNMKHLSLTPRTGHLTPGQKEGDNYQPNGMIHEKYTTVLRDFGMKENVKI